jgi:hypothetical protein
MLFPQQELIKDAWQSLNLRWHLYAAAYLRSGRNGRCQESLEYEQAYYDLADSQQDYLEQ